MEGCCVPKENSMMRHEEEREVLLLSEDVTNMAVGTVALCCRGFLSGDRYGVEESESLTLWSLDVCRGLRAGQSLVCLRSHQVG